MFANHKTYVIFVCYNILLVILYTAVEVTYLKQKQNKLKQLFLKNYHKFNRLYKWKKQCWNLKHPFIVKRITSAFFKIISFCVCFALFCLFLYGSEIIVFKNQQIFFDFSKSFNEHINMTSIITTQVSLTLIIVSISSLIANIENKYIYGKKALDLVFHKKGLFSFKIFFLLLFSFNFLNIYFLISNTGDAAIITVFILSIITIASFVYRFSSLFTVSYKIKTTLMNKYYKSNVKHIKQAKPLNTHKSLELENFKNATIKNIRENNETIYNENINVYFGLLTTTLFNYRKEVQQYYTEYITHSDLISHISTFCNELLEQKRYEESIKIFIKLYSLLNYYQIVIIRNHRILGMPSRYIEQFKYVKNNTEGIEYCKLLTQLIESQIYQVFLYTKIDLSYCRLYKHDAIYYFGSNEFIEELYNCIYENKNLNEIEKEKLYLNLFDYIRMSEFSEKHPEPTIEDFLKNNQIHMEEDVFPIEIRTEPIALLFLKMFENKDDNNIKLFLNMNISNRLMLSIKSFVILSITEMLYHDNNRLFMMDLDIDAQTTIDTISNSKMSNMTFNINELLEIYKTIADKYTIEKGDYTMVSYYGFCPKFRFSKNVIDTFFLSMAENSNILDEFITEIGDVELKKDPSVDELLQKYQQ